MKCSLVLECLDRGVGRREFGGDFRLRKKCLMALLSLTLALESVTGTAQAAISTSAGHSINNDTPGVDYKLSESEQKEILQQLKFGYMSNVDADESNKYLKRNSDVFKRGINVRQIPKVAPPRALRDAQHSESDKRVVTPSGLADRTSQNGAEPSVQDKLNMLRRRRAR